MNGKHDPQLVSLSNVEERYLDSISYALKRARNLLLTITLISAWLFAHQITTLVTWDDIRTPCSYNIGYAADNVLKDVVLTISKKDLRKSDYIDYKLALDSMFIKNDSTYKRGLVQVFRSNKYDGTEESVADSIATVQFPEGASFEEKAYWCREYYPFILRQKEDSVISSVRLLLDRAEISNTMLPSNVISKPYVDVPLVGLSIGLEDIDIVGGMFLIFMMLWFRFTMEQLYQNICKIRLYYHNEFARGRFFDRWLPLQFVFIPPPSAVRDGQIMKSAYLLFFIPFLVVFIALLIDISESFWQLVAYSQITGNSFHDFIPLSGQGNIMWQETWGIQLLQLLLLCGIAVFLKGEATISWKIINEIRLQIHGDDKEYIGMKRHHLVMWICIGVMFVWTIARCIGMWLKELDSYGWTYGISFLGLIILFVVVFAPAMWFLGRWRKRYTIPKFGEIKANPSENNQSQK